MKVKEMMKGLMNKADQNKPAILTGLTLVGLITSEVLMYKAALKCDAVLKDRKEKLRDAGSDVEVKEINKKTIVSLAKVFAPVAVSTVATGASAIGSLSSNNKKLALLTTAYNLSENTIRNMNQKMTDVLGEKKAREVKDAVKKDKLKANPIDPNGVTIKHTGDLPAKDVGFSKQTFVSSPTKIESVILELSDRVRSEMFVPLNDFLTQIGCESVKYGNHLGWNVEDTIYGRLPIEVTAMINDNKEVNLVIDYDVFARKDLVSG